MRPSGWTDKLYWRFTAEATAHCFKRAADGGYISLCERWWMPHSGGQSCSRPAPPARCGRCDGLEMQRRGHSESLEASLQGTGLPAHDAIRIAPGLEEQKAQDAGWAARRQRGVDKSNTRCLLCGRPARYVCDGGCREDEVAYCGYCSRQKIVVVLDRAVEQRLCAVCALREQDDARGDGIYDARFYTVEQVQAWLDLSKPERARPRAPGDDAVQVDDVDSA